MILTITLNPAIDRFLFLDQVDYGGLNYIRETQNTAGGKGLNISRILQRFGIGSMAMGFLGGPLSSWFRQTLETEKIDAQFIPIQGITRCNTKIIDRKTGDITELNEYGPVIQEFEWQLLMQELQFRAEETSTVIFSGKPPSGSPEDVYLSLSEPFQRHGSMILDTTGPYLLEGLKANPYLIKPNQDEFCETFGVCREFLSESIPKVREQYRIRNLLVTCGKEGSIFCGECGTFRISLAPMEVLNTVGAGDCLLAGLLCAMNRNANMIEAIQYGTACASVFVQCSSICHFSPEKVSRNLPLIQIQPLERN